MSISKETQNFDSIDFSQLDEETETDQPGGNIDGADQHHHNVDMDILQPHLSLPPPPSANARRNQRERGVVTVDEGSSGERTIHSSVSSKRDTDMPDEDVVTVTHSENVLKENDERGYDNNSNHMSTNQNGYHAEGYTSRDAPYTPTPGDDENENNVDNDNSCSSNNDSNATSSNPVQICYSKNTGNISVRQGQVSSVGQDGTRYIATQEIPQQWDESERKPLRKKRIRWIKIFSIISCILFFPTGIPAAYFAFRVEKEFEEGILRGNIDRAQKFATRSERLCILSLILCILVAALVVTLIERPRFQSEHYHRGTVTG